MENVSFSTQYSSTTPSVDQKSALQAGRLYERAGQLPKALTPLVYLRVASINGCPF